MNPVKTVCLRTSSRAENQQPFVGQLKSKQAVNQQVLRLALAETKHDNAETSPRTVASWHTPLLPGVSLGATRQGFRA